MSKTPDGNVVNWPGQNVAKVDHSATNSDTSAKFRVRLAGVLALVRAIEASETMAAVPECDTDRMHYVSTLNLLLLAERELAAICEEFET